MVVLEEFVVEFVQHPLDMSEIFDQTKAFLLDCIENISLNKNCLNEGWTDRPRGRGHMSNKSNSVFPECCFFTGFFWPYRTIFCCAVVRSKTAFLDSVHSFKRVALLKAMLYVNNTAYIVHKYWLF